MQGVSRNTQFTVSRRAPPRRQSTISLVRRAVPFSAFAPRGQRLERHQAESPSPSRARAPTPRRRRDAGCHDEGAGRRDRGRCVRRSLPRGHPALQGGSNAWDARKRRQDALPVATVRSSGRRPVVAGRHVARVHDEHRVGRRRVYPVDAVRPSGGLVGLAAAPDCVGPITRRARVGAGHERAVLRLIGSAAQVVRANRATEARGVAMAARGRRGRARVARPTGGAARAGASGCRCTAALPLSGATPAGGDRASAARRRAATTERHYYHREAGPGCPIRVHGIPILISFPPTEGALMAQG